MALPAGLAMLIGHSEPQWLSIPSRTLAPQQVRITRRASQSRRDMLVGLLLVSQTPMFKTDENPESNRLGEGVTDTQLDAAVRLSGYPLQRVVAEQLLGTFEVTEEWGYVDRETNDRRALDVFAHKKLKETSYLWINLALLVECKRSDLPFVFFAAAAPKIPHEFPVVAGLRGKQPELHVKGIGSTSAPASRFLGLHDFAFVAAGPPTCSAFTRAERKGKELDLSGSVPFNQVVLPLIGALKHFLDLQKTIGSQARVPACLAHPICVVDAPMVLVEGSPEAPRLKMCPWVRVVRQEAIREKNEGFWRHYVIDCVHRGYVTTFVHNHMLPFAEQFAERAASVDALLSEGKAGVPDFSEWAFADLKPWKHAG
jgi:hypothetical protein